MKYLLIMILFVGCGMPEWSNDQKERERIFFVCLEKIPKGPEKTKYNDWAEVVDECGVQAYYLTRKCVKNCE